MRAAHAGAMLRCQRFAIEQILGSCAGSKGKGKGKGLFAGVSVQIKIMCIFLSISPTTLIVLNESL